MIRLDEFVKRVGESPLREMMNAFNPPDDPPADVLRWWHYPDDEWARSDEVFRRTVTEFVLEVVPFAQKRLEVRPMACHETMAYDDESERLLDSRFGKRRAAIRETAIERRLATEEDFENASELIDLVDLLLSMTSRPSPLIKRIIDGRE